MHRYRGAERAGQDYVCSGIPAKRGRLLLLEEIHRLATGLEPFHVKRPLLRDRAATNGGIGRMCAAVQSAHQRRLVHRITRTAAAPYGGAS